MRRCRPVGCLTGRFRSRCLRSGQETQANDKNTTRFVIILRKRNTRPMLKPAAKRRCSETLTLILFRDAGERERTTDLPRRVNPLGPRIGELFSGRFKSEVALWAALIRWRPWEASRGHSPRPGASSAGGHVAVFGGADTRCRSVVYRGVPGAKLQSLHRRRLLGRALFGCLIRCEPLPAPRYCVYYWMSLPQTEVLFPLPVQSLFGGLNSLAANSRRSLPVYLKSQRLPRGGVRAHRVSLTAVRGPSHAGHASPQHPDSGFLLA